MGMRPGHYAIGPRDGGSEWHIGTVVRRDCRSCFPPVEARTAPLDEGRLREALRAVLRDFDREPTNEYLVEAERIFRADLVRQNVAMANATKLLASSDTAPLDEGLPGPDVPPLPWTSPALIQPWPNSASDIDEVRDAHGKRVFGGRNWKETCAAIHFAVRTINRAHFRAALAHPAPLDVPVEAEKAFVEAVNARSATGKGIAVPHIRDVDRIWDAIKPFLGVPVGVESEEGTLDVDLTCWRCEGRGWVRNGDIEDGMMTGRDNCLACGGRGRVSEADLRAEIERMRRVAAG